MTSSLFTIFLVALPELSESPQRGRVLEGADGRSSRPGPPGILGPATDLTTDESGTNCTPVEEGASRIVGFGTGVTNERGGAVWGREFRPPDV